MAHTDILTHGNFVIRQLHSPDKKKNFGILVLPVDYDGRNPELVNEYPDILTARFAIGAYDRKNVDRVGDKVIFKIIVDGVSLGYGFTPEIGKLVRCGSLEKARTELGWKRPNPVKLTPPKSSHPQNQKGYKAPTR